MDLPGQMELFAEFEGVKPLSPAHARQRAMIEELQARPLIGGRIEEGQILINLNGEEGGNLFNHIDA